MSRRRETSPPRPIAPGEVVAAYSDALGEWTAAQVTDLDPAWPAAGVLDLDWSGPEPDSVDDLGQLLPLRLTHHAHAGKVSHCNYEWLLPRGYKVIGGVPLLQERRSNAYSTGASRPTTGGHLTPSSIRRRPGRSQIARRIVNEPGRWIEAEYSDEADGSRFAELGRQFGEAFNQLDGTRNPFIETEERGELFGALDAIVDEAEQAYGRTFDTARQHLIAGVDSVRDW